MQYYFVKTNRSDLTDKNMLKSGKIHTELSAVSYILKWNVGGETLQQLANRKFYNAVIVKNQELDAFVDSLIEGIDIQHIDKGSGKVYTKKLKYDDYAERVNYELLYRHLVSSYDKVNEVYVVKDNPNFLELNLINSVESYNRNIANNSTFKSLDSTLTKELRKLYNSIKSVANISDASDDKLIACFINPDGDELNISKYLPAIIMTYLPEVDSTLSPEDVEMIAEAGSTSWDNCLKALESKTGDWTKYWSANMTDRPTFHCLGKFCELLNRSAIYEMLNRYVKDAI